MSEQEGSFWKISIDTGGTFTDCVGYSPSGKLIVVKVLSSGYLTGTIRKTINNGAFIINHTWPIDRDILSGYQFCIPGSGVKTRVLSFDPEGSTLETKLNIYLKENTLFELTANEEAPVLGTRMITNTALQESFPPILLRLGTTKGTNALLERNGAPTTLFITKGFKDLVYIGTQQRPELFQLAVPEPAILYDNVVEVQERMGHSGNPLSPPDFGCLEDIDLHTVDSAAIAFLNSYVNPKHEREIKAQLKEAGIQYISISSELSSSIKFLPRANTAVVNAYLQPVLNRYVHRIAHSIDPLSFMIMNSSGGLHPADQFHAKDSLLSGPAGGVIGAKHFAQQYEYEQIIAFDMGGTSTDVSRIHKTIDLRFKIEIDRLELSTPAMDIHTVAAGGGSICSFDGYHLTVGPASAGADPGPACYGKGGPLTITDVNVLLGKLPESALPIPVFIEKAREAMDEIQHNLAKSGKKISVINLLKSYERIANEKMAGAIRKISVNKGFDPADYVLVVYGGAGGLHACKLAELLKMKKILFHYLGGVLSAYGIANASLEETVDQYILKPVSEISSIEETVRRVQEEAKRKLSEINSNQAPMEIKYTALFIRISGQEHALELPYYKGMNIENVFEDAYKKLYGYNYFSPKLELVHILVTAAQSNHSTKYPASQHINGKQTSSNQDVYRWKDLKPGTSIQGPAVILQEYCTLFIEHGWKAGVTEQSHILAEIESSENRHREMLPEAAERELFTNRFQNIADEMGEQLKRTAHSVNVKERFDFSCALLSPQANLVVNAPHIPVHLGSLGVAAREMINEKPLSRGDVVICNHPKYGGSHLNDITLLSGVYSDSGQLIGYIINRAHHAEIGGKTPGSMPIHAHNLAEEGVVIPPIYLIRDGKDNWRELEKIFSEAPYPTRSIDSNFADIRAGLAALEKGKTDLRKLETLHGLEKLVFHMDNIQKRSAETLIEIIQKWQGCEFDVEEYLDDGSRIKVQVRINDGEIHFDFHGTSPVHPGNFNAGLAIVHSAIMYVLRILCPHNIPLNEGLMQPVRFHFEPSFLTPQFSEDVMSSPAVAAGNTEVSQRLVDTLLKAFSLCACSQGTMNNLLFGSRDFGYYETIGGGVGAMPGHHGRSAVHQHMTNTRITDPEELEWRYPVRLIRFAIREQSGGKGKWKGGNGIIREFMFLDDLEVTFIGQHRKAGPYGMKGGAPGEPGKQIWFKENGTDELLPGIFNIRVRAGDRLRIETPGGGGWGEPIISGSSDE